MRYHYLEGITSVIVEEAARLLKLDKHVCICCNASQEALIKRKYPLLAPSVTFKRNKYDS